MKLSQIREAYEEFTGKLSDITRQLSFSGIAIIWIFKVGDDSLVSIPKELIRPILFFVLSLIFDLLQYIYSSICWWRVYCKKKEEFKASFPNDDCEEKEVNEDEALNLPAWILFGFKLIFLITAYIFLFIFLVSRWQ